MIRKKEINDDLIFLETLHNGALITAAHPNLATYYAKLAIIEYCGWLEESFDKIARRSVKNKLGSNVELERCIRRVHGFEFDRHFMNLMKQVVGLKACEELKHQLGLDGSDALLSAELDNLKTRRNNAAHVNTRTPIATAYDAPSVVIASLNRTYPIIRRIYTWAVNC